jgi:hypothetical protein
MFDDRVGRIAEPVGIHHLLKRLGVNLLLRLAGPGLKLGINGELHDGGPSPQKPPILSRGAATLSKRSASLQAVGGLLGEDNFPTAC